MYERNIKRVCICEDDDLPVIIKINPCPGKTCPYARESIPSLIEEKSSTSIASYTESSDDDDEEEITNNERIDSATSTSNGKNSTGTEVFDDFQLLECGAFEKDGKCMNDAECATTDSLHRIVATKIQATKANQVLCHHTQITKKEHDKAIEETIMRSQSRVGIRETLQPEDKDEVVDKLSRISVIYPAQSISKI